MPQADELLVQRSRAGDREAFEELVRLTARLVFARAYLECGDVHAAEDLVQETYLRAWRSVRQVKDANSFRPWLMSILHAVVVDSARHNARKKRSGNTAELTDVPDMRTPADALTTDEERQAALSALRGLPEEYRQVLTLRYLAGADYETIGRELAISNGSLRGLLHRGMELLRSRMNKSEMKP